MVAGTLLITWLDNKDAIKVDLPLPNIFSINNLTLSKVEIFPTNMKNPIKVNNKEKSTLENKDLFKNNIVTIVIIKVSL